MLAVKKQNAMQRAKLLSKWNESPNTPLKFVSTNNDIVLRLREDLQREAKL